MQSIRKIKKLLKRNPILVEISVPTWMPQEALAKGGKHMKEVLGENFIVLFLPYREIESPQPIGMFKAGKDLSVERAEEFKKQWEELTSSRGSSAQAFPITASDLSFIDTQDRNRVKIHSVVKLTTKQHSEILQAIKDSQKGNLIQK